MRAIRNIAALCLALTCLDVVAATGVQKLRSWLGPDSLIVGTPPTPRCRFGFSNANGNLFVFGGWSGTVPLGDLHQFNPASLQWNELTELVQGTPPSARTDLGFASANGLLYLFGGATGDNTADHGNLDNVADMRTLYVSKELFTYDPSLLRWTDMSNIVTGSTPSSRHSHGFASCTVSNQPMLFLFGGFNSQGALGDFYQFDPSSAAWTDLTMLSNAPSARALHGVASAANTLFVYGGISNNGTVLGDMHKYDPVQHVWTVIYAPSQMVPRHSLGFASTQNLLFIFSGMPTAQFGFNFYNSEWYCSDLYIYNTSSGIWKDKSPTLPTTAQYGMGNISRYSAGLTSINGDLFLFGGFNDHIADGELNDLHKITFSVSSNSTMQYVDLSARDGTCTKFANAPSARSAPGLTSSNGKLYLFGGGDDSYSGGTDHNDLYSFDLSTLKWQQIGTSTVSTPGPRLQSGFVAGDDGNLYMCGGYLESSSSVYASTWTFSLLTNQWTQLFDMPEKLYGHGLATATNSLFVLGGIYQIGTSDYYSRQMYKLDLSSLPTGGWATISSSLNVSIAYRYWFGFTRASNGLLYVFGGETPGGHANDLLEYDPSAIVQSSAWRNISIQAKGDPPVPRYAHGFTSTNGKLFAFAGLSDSGFMDDLHQFDLSTMTWTELTFLLLGPSPSTVVFPGFTAWNGVLYAWGGNTKVSTLNDLWAVVPPVTKPWPTDGQADQFLDIYDWDTLDFQSSVLKLTWRLILCNGGGMFPCTLSLTKGTVYRTGNGSIACLSSKGCSQISLQDVQFHCDDATAAYPALEIEGAALNVTRSSFLSCSSITDGGTIRAYSDAVVNVVQSTFKKSTSAGYGGVISVNGGVVSIVGSAFIDCSAKGGGGAVSAASFQSYGYAGATNAILDINSSSFEKCSSLGPGGALLATGGSFGGLVTANVLNCTFTSCISGTTGGAISANESANVQITDAAFRSNVAEGLGGGALFADTAYISLESIDSSNNSAPAGGGGAFLWNGEIEPMFSCRSAGKVSCSTRFVAATSVLSAANTCEYDNHAIYGPCVATTFKDLSMSGIPAQSSPAYAGMAFTLQVIMLDSYNQTISVDSSSLLQATTSLGQTFRPDPSVTFLGSTAFAFDQGISTTTISIKPSFRISSQNGIDYQALLQDSPHIYFQLHLANSLVQTPVFPVAIWQGADVCPPGYILFLDSTNTAAGRPGECRFCSAGTYSLNQLSSSSYSQSSFHDPSCLKCPAGGDCISGGSIVIFSVGQWIMSQSMYHLASCPEGYSLINSTAGSSRGQFSHDAQTCLSCGAGKYLVDQMEQCHDCPDGATCGADASLTGLPGSYWRREGDEMRVFKCDPGYVMVRQDDTYNEKSYLDSCKSCESGKYSLVGAVIVSQPSCTVNENRSGYLCNPTQAQDIRGALDQNLNGAWVTTSQLSCLNCPAGGDCTGGNVVIFSVGQWIVSQSMYHLASCPEGYSLINSTAGSSRGQFSHDAQTCLSCGAGKYLVDEMEQCHDCPDGAACGAEAVLTGLPGSYWRREGDEMRVFKCDPGYVMVRQDDTYNEKSYLDSCKSCESGKYSLVGAVIVSQPSCTVNGDGSGYICTPTQAQDIRGALDQNLNGAWVNSSELVETYCLPCPNGATCTGGSNVVPLQGFWVPQTNNSVARRVHDRKSDDQFTRRAVAHAQDLHVAQIFRCPQTACESGGSCVEGRQGMVCGICKAGWALSSGNCEQCPTDTSSSRVGFGVACALIGLVVIFYFSWKPLFEQSQGQGDSPECGGKGIGEKEGKEDDEDDDSADKGDKGKDSANSKKEYTTPGNGPSSAKDYMERGTYDLERTREQLKDKFRDYVQGYMKVLIGYFQVLSTFLGNFSVTWPSEVMQLFHYASIFRFDLMSVPGPSCLAADLSYQTKLLIYTVTPVVIIAVLAIAPLWSTYISKYTCAGPNQNSVSRKIKDQFWFNLLIFLFLIYPTVSLATLQTFNCQDLGVYGSFLIADFREACPNSKLNFVFWWSVFCTIVYPVGIPVFFLLIMMHYRVPKLQQRLVHSVSVQTLITTYHQTKVCVAMKLLLEHLRKKHEDTLQTFTEDEANKLFGIIYSTTYDATYSLPARLSKNLQSLLKESGIHDSMGFHRSLNDSIYLQNLFTGYENVDQMNLEQLSVIYEFYRVPDDDSDKPEKESTALEGAKEDTFEWFTKTAKEMMKRGAVDILDKVIHGFEDIAKKAMKKITKELVKTIKEKVLGRKPKPSLTEEIIRLVDDAQKIMELAKNQTPSDSNGPIDTSGCAHTSLLSVEVELLANMQKAVQPGSKLEVDHLDRSVMKVLEQLFWDGHPEAGTLKDFKANILPLLRKELEETAAKRVKSGALVIPVISWRTAIDMKTPSVDKEGGSKERQSENSAPAPETPASVIGIIGGDTQNAPDKTAAEVTKDDRRDTSDIIVAEEVTKADTKDTSDKISAEVAEEDTKDTEVKIPAEMGKSDTMNTSKKTAADEATKDAEGAKEVVGRLGFLIMNYEVQCWYFEISEMVRKLLMTTLVVFIYPGSVAQIAAAFFITFLATVHSLYTKPFVDERVDNLHNYALVTQCFTLLFGLMVAVQQLSVLANVNQPTTSSEALFGRAVIFLNTAIVAFPMFQKASKAVEGAQAVAGPALESVRKCAAPRPPPVDTELNQISIDRPHSMPAVQSTAGPPPSGAVQVDACAGVTQVPRAGARSLSLGKAASVGADVVMLNNSPV